MNSCGPLCASCSRVNEYVSHMNMFQGQGKGTPAVFRYKVNDARQLESVRFSFLALMNSLLSLILWEFPETINSYHTNHEWNTLWGIQCFVKHF